MKHYTLLENEVCLYEGTAFGKDDRKLYTIILTNLHIVLIHEKPKLFKANEVTVNTYPVDQIKFYNEQPQVKINHHTVEIYLKTCELKLDCTANLSDARNLHNALMKLLTGENLAERKAKDFKKSVALVDDTLGIDTLGTAKNVIENGVVGTLTTGTKKSSSNKVLNAADAIGGTLN